MKIFTFSARKDGTEKSLNHAPLPFSDTRKKEKFNVKRKKFLFLKTEFSAPNDGFVMSQQFPCLPLQFLCASRASR